MMMPVFFETQLVFRKWLELNHQKEKELMVGFYKVNSGKPSMTWSESVDQALCFGWIDSTVKRIDDETYMQKYTPRKAKSIWSLVNKNRVIILIEKKKMTKNFSIHQAHGIS